MASPGRPSLHVTRGPVFLIGGAEDKRRGRAILSRFVEMAGGADASIIVVGTASSMGDQAAVRYAEVFGELGAGKVVGLRPLSREQANAPDVSRAIAASTGIFLTGGNQLRLVQVIGGTRVEDALASAHDRGAVIAGTSAGASALAGHMVGFGRPGATPKHRMVNLSAGLGLVEDVIVDQHFQQRGRWGRLLAAVALSPRLIGLGLDEDTAALVYPDRTLEVVGRGSVAIVDGSAISSDAHRTHAHRPMMVSGAIVHTLPDGYRFDLRAREVVPAEEADEREASE